MEKKMETTILGVHDHQQGNLGVLLGLYKGLYRRKIWATIRYIIIGDL